MYRTITRSGTEWCAFALLVFLVCAPGIGHAQNIHEDVSGVERAEVLRVIDVETRTILGTETEHIYQTLEAELLSGEKKGNTVTVQNDFLELEVGDRFFVIHYSDVGGIETYSVQDVDRRGAVATLLAFFVVAIILFGGWYGVRALVSLGTSFFVLAYILVPGLLAGWPPLFTCFLVAGVILGGAIFITHGVNRESCVAFSGTLIAIGVTILVATWSVAWTGLSGFSAEESVYLNFNTRGSLDLVALFSQNRFSQFNPLQPP
jgi:uncharacterized membrane protein